MVTDAAARPVAFSSWLLAWFTKSASAAVSPAHSVSAFLTAFLPWLNPDIPSSSVKKTAFYIPPSSPGLLSQGQHPAPSLCASLLTCGWWPASLLRLSFLAKISGLEFVFLPAGSTGRVGRGWEWADTAPCTVSGWVQLTMMLQKSGLSRAYASHWEHKVVPLTAENGFLKAVCEQHL